MCPDATRHRPSRSLVYFHEVVETYPFLQTAKFGADQAISFYELIAYFSGRIRKPEVGLTSGRGKDRCPSFDLPPRQITVFVSLDCRTKPIYARFLLIEALPTIQDEETLHVQDFAHFTQDIVLIEKVRLSQDSLTLYK